MRSGLRSVSRRWFTVLCCGLRLREAEDEVFGVRLRVGAREGLCEAAKLAPTIAFESVSPVMCGESILRGWSW